MRVLPPIANTSQRNSGTSEESRNSKSEKKKKKKQTENIPNFNDDE